MNLKKLTIESGFNLKGLSSSFIVGLFTLQTLSFVFFVPQKAFYPVSHETQKTESFDGKKMIIRIIDDFRTGLKEEEKVKLAETIFYESLKYGHDPLLVVAVIKTESSFNKSALSGKGAKGLMQIRSLTAGEIAEEANFKWESGDDLYNPLLNIKMGTYYLFKLKLIFNDIDLVLEAYNNGPTKVSRMVRNGERIGKRYSKKVLSYYRALQNRQL